MSTVPAWGVVSSLGSALSMGGSALQDVPGLLVKVLEHEVWREFPTPRGHVARNETFAEFVTSPPTKGLGASVELLERLVADDPKARNLLDLATQRPSHRPTGTVDNVNSSRPDGNAANQALRRLRKDRPDLHQDVLEGRTTPHAAMVTAGYRPRTVTVRLDDPRRAAATLRKKLTPEQRQQLAAYLLEDV